MSNDFVLMGKIVGVYGIKGYAKVHSYTRPIENILKYKSWLLQQPGKQHEMTVADARKHGQGIIAQFDGIDDRDDVKQFTGADILVGKAALPVLAADEIYWNELIGLSVFNLQGDKLGKIVDIQETGANDVFIVEHVSEGNKRRLIPWVTGDYLHSIDVENDKIIVDWLKEYDQ